MRSASPFLLEADHASVTGRWTPGRKEALLTAIRLRHITEADACERYGLTREELATWRTRFAFAGRPGLYQTKLQEMGR